MRAEQGAIFTWPRSAVAAFGIGLSLALPVGKLPHVPLCWFKEMTGWPCAGCGLTRSVLSIGHGDLAEAWGFNPFGFAFYAILLLFLVGPLLKRVAPGAERFLAHPAVIGAGVACFVGGLLAFGAWRWAQL